MSLINGTFDLNSKFIKVVLRNQYLMATKYFTNILARKLAFLLYFSRLSHYLEHILLDSLKYLSYLLDLTTIPFNICLI